MDPSQARTGELSAAGGSCNSSVQSSARTTHSINTPRTAASDTGELPGDSQTASYCDHDAFLRSHGLTKFSVRNIHRLDNDYEPLLEHLRQYRAHEFLAKNSQTYSFRPKSPGASGQSAPWRPAGNKDLNHREPRPSKDKKRAVSAPTSRASARNRPLSIEEQIQLVETEIRRVNGQKVWRMARTGPSHRKPESPPRNVS